MSQIIKSFILLAILVALTGYKTNACPFSREQASVMLAKIRMYYPDLIQQQGTPYGMNQGYGQGQGLNNQGYGQGLNNPLNQGLTNPLNQGLTNPLNQGQGLAGR